VLRSVALALGLLLLIDGARAEEPRAASLELGAEGGKSIRSPRLRRRVGIGLLAGSGLSLALAFTFVGLAKSANDDVLSGDRYHPDQEDRRQAFEGVHAAFFTLSVATFIPGMLLVWDR
jgi:hypothetical protein